MVLLSFDIEEFDMPFEYGKTLPFAEQISISVAGSEAILNLLDAHGIKATFFSTANFANHATTLIEKIVSGGHEIASHGYYHSDFKPEHLLQSKQVLEKISGQPVNGYRMARMMPVNDKEIEKAGYLYNSSLNPTYLPGRYNNLRSPRTYFMKEQVWQLPASVSPMLRIPLFWLSFHNFPLSLYKHLCSRTYKKDKYLNLYFHPWEFTDLDQKEKFGLPGYVARNSGQKMIERLDQLISWMKSKSFEFGTFNQFFEEKILPQSKS